MTTGAPARRPWTTRRITIWAAVATAVLLLAVAGALVVKNAAGMHGVSDEQRATNACQASVLAQAGVTSATTVFSPATVSGGTGGQFHVTGTLEDPSVLALRSPHVYLCTVQRWSASMFVAEGVHIY